MNLKSLGSSELVRQTLEAVHTEKLSTLLVLKHLREIDSRRLYLKYGYPSLFEMTVKHFGYSLGAAQRRISSMRLIRDLPEVSEKIEKGELSLTTASQLQTFFKQEKNKPYSAVKKSEVVAKCLNKSSREVEKELISLRPEKGRRDDVRYTDHERLRLSLNISERLFQKLERLQYKYGGSSKEELIEMLVDKAEKPAEISLPAKASMPMEVPFPAPKVKTRHIPAVTKKIVMKENKNQGCRYIDPITKKPCEMKSNLQFDHVQLHSHGGPNIVENLRLLCGHHNRYVWHNEQKIKTDDS